MTASLRCGILKTVDNWLSLEIHTAKVTNWRVVCSIWRRGGWSRRGRTALLKYGISVMAHHWRTFAPQMIKIEKLQSLIRKLRLSLRFSMKMSLKSSRFLLLRAGTDDCAFGKTIRKMMRKMSRLVGICRLSIPQITPRNPHMATILCLLRMMWFRI